MLRGSLDGRELEENGYCTYMAELPGCAPETITTLLIGYESESDVSQSCPTLCDRMDCSLPCSSIHGIFQARVLGWVAISFSRGSSLPRDWPRVFCIVGRRFTIWATREVTGYSPIFNKKLKKGRMLASLVKNNFSLNILPKVIYWKHTLLGRGSNLNVYQQRNG